MKTIIFLFCLFISSQAFSKHNYFDERCIFHSSKGDILLYKYRYWDGFHMVINSDLEGLDDYPDIFLPADEGSGDDIINGNEAIIFSDIKDSNIIKVPYNDGCWQGFTATLDRGIKIDAIKLNIQSILKLYPNDKLSLKCTYEHLILSGDYCLNPYFPSGTHFKYLEGFKIGIINAL